MIQTKIENHDDLIAALKASDKDYDIEKIERAYEVADKAHGGQVRRSGDPYISHPVSVAIILIGMGMDTDCICAALLHDVVEDTAVTLDELKKAFGADVAVMVGGVTKLTNMTFSTKEEQQAENIRKMLLAMNEDIRVILIKLADRLHNMRTMQYQTPEKQRSKSHETMEIYAPIAHRLGIRSIKDELEDLALRYLDPVAYKEIEERLDMNKKEREEFIKSVQKRILDRFAEYGFHPHIEGRVKSIYGIYRKIYVKGKSFEEIYDIYAVRLIVDTTNECYNALGIIHDMFTPIPNRFKDYISTPKPNQYQSLHTSVLDHGVPFEVQIRTWDMHYTAEYGIAAHWKYKAGISKGDVKSDKQLEWVRKIIESQQEAEGEDLMRNIRTDLSSDDVFVFTPKGDVKNLPAGSTIIDFAYAIHTAVGNKMTGAKVDGRIVPLSYELKTGEIVEILTAKNGTGPKRGWLEIAKTSEARNKIRGWFKRERRDENIAAGKAVVEQEFKRNQIRFDTEEGYLAFMDDLVRRQHKDSLDDLYASIGYGGLVLSHLMPRIKDAYAKQTSDFAAQELEKLKKAAAPKKSNTPVIVDGIVNCQVKFAKCCNPLPGDDIVGFITRGYGVSVHKRDCVNAQASLNDVAQKERWIKVRWAEDVPVDFRSSLQIIATDRDGLAMDVTLAIANLRVPLHEITARGLKNGNAEVLLTISTQGKEHLDTIIQRLKKIPGVISVERSGK
ncbi:MAG: bifunctional (p)ppGpp synthetase/guanosine-3',5'-bis(diphosphate) 3'-pyrophosphohydrolase [Candidatus Faecivivens sp.]|nr:bifunctional (p)ppGpp synthetase/guanosine-3',5'-bis(diphosphate) 3'-pyrophosphohydrolase [Oscillospiraceae bacterium]MDY2713622.1 bifunctional (p)ppGpp synthetase/guanosine-3',5'-bis(diphosphate) 3'-pyrophosphohydrolase [Candidatus Faecivivens sp.]